MIKNVSAPQLRGFVSGVIDTPSKGVSRYTSAVLLIFTLALSACGGENLPTAERLLAVAYINTDELREYSDSVDILIAGLYDTNDDGVPSQGDTVRYGQYPQDFSALLEPLKFTNQTHTVGSVSSSGPARVSVNVASSEVYWDTDAVWERFIESRKDIRVFLADAITPGSISDEITVNGTSIAAPAMPITIFDSDDSDGHFLNVRIFVGDGI